MLEAVDSRVLKLVRTAIGPLGLGNLPIGKWRDLTPEEVRLLGGEVSRPETGFRGKLNSS
jgi:16S rRNA U516 pseudouridylate synthase RsuA-like enzyme